MPGSVLITGGAGYIGSHTTLALNEAGYETIVFDNLSTGHRKTCFGNKFIEGDIRNQSEIKGIFGHFDIDCVVHFAALIEAGGSVRDPLSFYENNVAGTCNLLKAMQVASVDKLVFSSTAAVYGNQNASICLSEDLKKDPINPYGHSKAMVETMLEDCVTSHGLNSIALRYFNACGADPDGRSGEMHIPETHLIPLAIETARGLREEIKIFGNDYETPDGTCVRDYIHVTDIANAHVKSVERLISGEATEFKAINLGSNNGYSVKEIIDAVKRISQEDFKVSEAERREGDPATLVAETDLAREFLGWVPKLSDIDQIVADAWRFATDNL